MFARKSEAQISPLPGQRATEVALAEADLMRAARDDPACFEPIYDCYFPRVYLYCLRRVETSQEAEDLTSEVFTRALAGLDGYQGGWVAAWLFRIARNAVANYYRDRHAPHDVPDEMPDPRLSPEEDFAQAEDRARARVLVASLPEKEQEIVSLRVYAGLTSAEIGVIMGMRAGAVRMHLHRALKKLGAHFSSEEPA